MASEQAKFKFRGYRITEATMHIAADRKVDQQLNVSFPGIRYNTQDHTYTLILGVTVTNEDKSLDISVEMVGFFEFDRDLSQKEKDCFFSANAPAIMFPYIRAYISTVTGTAGIEPIILPTINFAEALRKVEAK